MSVTHLEDFVHMMVKSEAAAKAVDGPNWRETLHRLVTRCYRPKDIPKSRGSGEVSFVNAIELANSVVSEYSPVVSLYDVVKYQANEDSPNSNQPPQDEFLQYFSLGLNNNFSSMKNEKPDKVYCSSHPRNLINSPQVPFSSELGKKLTKERPKILNEIHERKLERLERYLHVIPSSDEVQYEVIYNKTLDLDTAHFYTFPCKKFHDKKKLTPKARHLLTKYCKPCSVKLLRLDTKKMKPVVPRHSVEKEKDQKENIQLLKNKGILLESRVVLTENFNLNPFKASKSLTNKPILKSSRQKIFLKTLRPRNENTMAITKVANRVNLVDACVLQPINNLIELKKNKIEKSKKVKNGRIIKKRAKPYYPRRYSPRLKITNKPLIM